MSINLDNQSRVLILGESGGGKTYLARSFLKHFKRVIIITPHPNEFQDYPNRVVTLDKEKVFETINLALKEGNLMLVIDDSDILLEKIEKDERFNLFIKGGRHRGVGYTIISRRTADIPTMAAKQANRVMLFQTDLPHDIKFYNDYFGPQAAMTVRGLDREKHEFYYWNKDRKEESGVLVA